MDDYLALVSKVIMHGTPRQSRVGPTRQRFGERLDWDMRYGFPLLTTRKIYWRPILGELAAFIQGADHVDDFREQGCNYWDQDAARWNKSGFLGRIYGVQWRRWASPWSNRQVDQLRNLTDGLIADPYGRRHIITAWNPGEMDQMALPPCHILTQFNVGIAQDLDCIVYMRSVDLCLGLPSDLVLYGALLKLVAEHCGYRPRMLTFFLADCHVYENHVVIFDEHQARKPPFIAPKWLNVSGNDLFAFKPDLVDMVEYAHHPAIKYPLNTTETPNAL